MTERGNRASFAGAMEIGRADFAPSFSAPQPPPIPLDMDGYGYAKVEP